MKPKYKYACPCGYRTRKSWKFAAHRRKHRRGPAKEA